MRPFHGPLSALTGASRPAALAGAEWRLIMLPEYSTSSIIPSQLSVICFRHLFHFGGQLDKRRFFLPATQMLFRFNYVTMM